MPSKEKTLLVVVVAAVAGVAALDGSYVPVAVPSTRPPSEKPEPPAEAAAEERSGAPPGRSMFEPFSDLEYSEKVVLEMLPLPSLPIASPPVRPGPHRDVSAVVPRHFLFEPAEKAELSAVDQDPPPDEAAPSEAKAAPDETEKPAAEPPPDLADFDWVVLVGDTTSRRNYGRISLREEDEKKGRHKFELLTDTSLEFVFWAVSTATGKHIGAPAPFRARTQELGFSDTFENNYGSKRIRLEAAAGRKNLDLPQLRELVGWCMEQAALPRYKRRECWTRAAENLTEILRRKPADKEVVKELGRTHRLLQDFEAEAGLYEWWLSRQQIARDPEINALLGETFDILGLRDRARACYEEALVTNPDARVRLLLGENLLATNLLEDARKAVEVFRRATQDGERVEGPLGEARALLATGDVEGARKVTEERIPAPDRGAAWYCVEGAVLYAQGKVQEAKDHFEAAVAKSTKGDDVFAMARTNLAIAKARLAALLPEADSQGAPNAARIAALTEAIKLAEDALADDPLNYYWPLVAKAYALRARGDRDQAVDALQEAVAALPGEAYGRYLLGEFMLRDGRAPEARTQFLEASRLAPRFPDALAGVGRAGGGEPGESAAYLRRAAMVDKVAPLWPLLSGLKAMAEGALPEAGRDLEGLLKRANERANSFAQSALGRVRYYQGDADEALSQWNSALRSLANTTPASVREGEVLESLKVWVQDARDRVAKWQKTRIWTDDFKRSDGAAIGNGWHEDEKQVKWSIRDGDAVCGPGRLGQNEETRLWREEDLTKVLKSSTTVRVNAAEPFYLDATYFVPGAGGKPVVRIGVRKTESGELRLLVKNNQKITDKEEPRDIGMKWPEDGRVTIGFTKMDEKTGSIRLELNGEPVPGFESVEFEQFIKGRGGKIRCEIRCYGAGGSDVNAAVERVQIWKEVQ